MMLSAMRPEIVSDECDDDEKVTTFVISSLLYGQAQDKMMMMRMRFLNTATY